MKKTCILIVEDEKKLSRILVDFFCIQGYETLTAFSGREAIKIFSEQRNKIDILLLDLMLPDFSGEEVLNEIRTNSNVPVIIVSAKSSVEDQMRGFEKGADDYISKPFTLELLKLHIEAVLRRAGKNKSFLTYGNLRVDLKSRRVYWKESFVDTTTKEYELLVYFMEHSDTVLSRSTILDGVWGYDYIGDIRTVDTLVKQLRKKLTDECTYIRSVYGVGYLFAEEEDEKI